MDGETRSMIAMLARLELSGVLTLGWAARHYAELMLGHGESFTNSVLAIAREPNVARADKWDQAVSEAAAEYRDYVRELAAFPGLATLTFLDQLDALRKTRARPGETRDEPAPRKTKS
jgi:hypothetical protein